MQACDLKVDYYVHVYIYTNTHTNDKESLTVQLCHHSKREKEATFLKKVHLYKLQVPEIQ